MIAPCPQCEKWVDEGAVHHDPRGWGEYCGRVVWKPKRPDPDPRQLSFDDERLAVRLASQRASAVYNEDKELGW